MLTPSPTDTAALLAEVEALLAAATPGPWRAAELWHGGGSYATGPFHHGRDSKDDARLIAAAPTLLRSLADRVRDLEALATGDAETIAAYATFARAVYRAHATPGCEEQGVRLADLPRLAERVRETAEARERLEAATLDTLCRLHDAVQASGFHAQSPLAAKAVADAGTILRAAWGIPDGAPIYAPADALARHAGRNTGGSNG